MNDSLELYLKNNFQVASEIELISVQALLDGLRRIRDSGSTLWIAGNGGSAAAASHAVVDFVKTAVSFGSKPLRAISLSDIVSLQTALSNDVAFEKALGDSLSSLSRPGDGLLVLSVSGTSPNLLYAIDSAKRLAVDTFAITGLRGRALCEQTTNGICIPSDDYQIVENVHMLLIHWIAIALGGDVV